VCGEGACTEMRRKEAECISREGPKDPHECATPQWGGLCKAKVAAAGIKPAEEAPKKLAAH